LYRVVHTPPRRPGSLVPLPADVDLVLALGLAKRADDRFATAAELADALAAALADALPVMLRARGDALVRREAWS
jgi:hypothetical protein